MSERFDCKLAIGAIRDGDRIELIAADEELVAFTERLLLADLSALHAHAILGREGSRVTASGRIGARLTQACVATGEPVPAVIDEPFELAFLPEPETAREAEVELGADDLDIVFHDGSRIALGDALVDTLALALDPYPRSPGADDALRAAGVLSEEEAGPFAALAALKGRTETGP